MGSWGWLVGIPLKALFLIAFFVVVRLLAMAVRKLMPDSRLKRALFSGYGDIRSAWRSYPADMRSDSTHSSPTLIGRQRGD